MINKYQNMFSCVQTCSVKSDPISNNVPFKNVYCFDTLSELHGHRVAKCVCDS